MRLDNPSISGSISYLGGGTNTISGTDAKITGSFTGSFIGAVSGTSSVATTASYIELSNVDGSASLASRITSNSSSIASLETVSGSYANSASFASDISANSASISSLEKVSGSYANSASFASNISANSASIGSLNSVSGSYANSASFASDISTNSSSIGSLNAVSSSYLLNTTDTLTGDLTVTGNIIATTLNVQDVTASVVYSSGSNIFGSSSIDTQQFTGSILTSGSIEVNGDKFTVNGATGNTVIAGTTVINDTLYLTEYIQHLGNTSNNIRFTTDAIAISANATFAGDVSLANLKSIYLGTSSALRIYTDSAVGIIKGNDVRLVNASGDNIFRVNGDSAELYHNDSKKFETTSTGVSVTGGVTLSGDISASTGDLALLSSSGEYILYGATDGQTNLYHNGLKKFETTSTGIAVSGTSSTFAGIVETDKIFVAKGQNVSHTASSIKISQESTSKSQIRFYGANSSTSGILEFVGSTSNGSASGARLTLNADGSSTFAGNLTVDGTVLIDGLSNYTGLEVKGSGASRPAINFTNVNQGNLGSIFGTEGNALVTSAPAGLEYQVRNANGASGDHVFKSYNTAILTLDGGTNNSTFAGNVTLSQSTNGAEAKLILTSKSAAGNSRTGIVEYDADTEKIFFINESTTVAAMTSGGNVGIGIDSPSAQLEVVTAVGGDAIRLNFGQSADIFLGFNSANPRVLLQDNSNVVTHNFQSNGDNYIVGSNVGIGTTSPSEKLQVKGNICVNSESVSTATAEIDKIEFKKSHPNGVSGYYTLGEIRSKTFGGYSGGLNFYTGRATTPGSYASTFAMTIDNKGQVGIGVEALPTDIYTASGGGYAVLGLGQSSFLTAYKSDDSIELCQNTYLNTSGANNGVTASVPAARLTLVDGQFVFTTLQTAANYSQTAINAMKITDGGILFVGDTGTNYGYSAHHIAKSSPSGYSLIVRNSDTSTTNNTVMQLNRAETTATTQGYALIYRQGDPSSGTNRMIVFANGDIQNTNGSYGSLSDERKKENIVDATPKLDNLMKVKVRNFNLKGDDLKQIGVVAQELEEVFPGMISESKDPDSKDETLYKSVKYSVFVPMLIKAIQELEARIKILENK